MAKRDTPWFQRDRYYTFERNDRYYVGYFRKGTNLQLTKDFATQEERADWVAESLKGFVAFKP